MSYPRVLVDDFPPCPTCGGRITGASYRRHEGWFRTRTTVLLRPCGHILTGDSAEMWASVAMGREF